METPSRELRLLTNALRQPIFRFIVIGHNRKHIIDDIADHLKATYPNRPFLTLRLNGKAYRDIIDTLNTFREGIVLIPDFDWLFRLGNEDLCTAFNQRRDALARLPMALLCFVEPSGYTNVPKRIPDWWSLRSLALEFHSDETDLTDTFLETDTDVSSLGGQTKAEKEAEIERLQKQLRLADTDNRVLLLSLNQQIGNLYHQLSRFSEALPYLEQSLKLARQIGDRAGEGATLNNISQIYTVKGDYETALHYLEQSLSIRQQIGDRKGEGTTLNNISQIYTVKGDYETALHYLEQSLSIRQQIGDRKGEATVLHNLGAIYYEQFGNIQKAIPLLMGSYSILNQIGSSSVENPVGYLNAIIEQIGEERFNQIVQSTDNKPKS